MALSILVLILSALLIYFSCKLFVNGIEWVGQKFNVADNAVGTILAAFGTALPESIVTFIAVAFGVTANQKDVGIGAALGGPLILSTVAYAVVGWCIYAYQRKQIAPQTLLVDGVKLGRDQLWFLGIFAFNILLGFAVFPAKAFFSLPLLAVYGLYCFKEMRVPATEAPQEELPPLSFRAKQKTPETSWVLLQTFFSLALIFVGSQAFVSQLDFLSTGLGVPPHIISLFLSPIATELPEILNAVIWVRQGKIPLALSNISGSMMVQATIPSALGIFYTPWLFDSYLAIAVTTTMVSILFLWSTLKTGNFSAKSMSFTAVFYGFFAVGAYWLHSWR